MARRKGTTIESLVRGKNHVYTKWRVSKTKEELDTYCTECLFRFGTLPHWVTYPVARRQRNWTKAGYMEKAQRAWRNKIRCWALNVGVITYPNQFAQFYKYYSAWYRFKQEQENGPIRRMFARQMY